MSDTNVRQAEQRLIAIEIETEIRKLLQPRSARASVYGPDFVELWDIATQCVLGGKLLRPRLVVGSFDALVGDTPQSADLRRAALEIAAALELLHFSFLVHDDVIDEDLLRRGAPNLIGRLVGIEGPPGEDSPSLSAPDGRRLHWARSSGILIGDLMLSIAHQAFARVRLDEEDRLRLLDLLDHAVTETVAGEQCDVGLADGLITSDLSIVLEMTRMKTATYTFEFPLRAAAVVAGADIRLEQQLGAIGRHLGVAFQLQDDLLSAFGRSEAHGKDHWSDFREGKETSLIAYARMTNAWPNIEPLLGAADFSDKTGEMIHTLLIKCGAKQFIESMVQDQIRTALDILSREDTLVPAKASRFVLSLVESLEGRVV